SGEQARRSSRRAPRRRSRGPRRQMRDRDRGGDADLSRSVHRWLVRVAAALAIAAVSAAGTLCWVAFHSNNPIASSLTAGLQDNWEIADPEFNRRVMARFPP